LTARIAIAAAALLLAIPARFAVVATVPGAITGFTRQVTAVAWCIAAGFAGIPVVTRFTRFTGLAVIALIRPRRALIRAVKTLDRT
jgi:hypothetical protein